MTTGVHDKYLNIFLSIEIIMLNNIRLFPFKPNFPLHTGHKKLHKSHFMNLLQVPVYQQYFVFRPKKLNHNYLSKAFKLHHKDQKSLLCTYLVLYEL